MVVAKLDRLSRDVHFISGLMQHRVPFIVADSRPSVTAPSPRYAVPRRRGAFDRAADCRLAVAEDERPDGRFAGLLAKIKSARWSRERTALLMSLMQ